MSVDVTNLVMQKYEINKLIKEIDRDTNRLHEMEKQLKRQCFHPTTKTDEQYHKGGYDYVSSVRITVTCTLCGTVLDSYDDPKHKGMHS